MIRHVDTWRNYSLCPNELETDYTWVKRRGDHKIRDIYLRLVSIVNLLAWMGSPRNEKRSGPEPCRTLTFKEQGGRKIQIDS